MRWAWLIDRGGVDYDERPHLQLIHVFAARLAGGGRTVPVFVNSAGEVFAESSDVLRWADTQVEPGRQLYPKGDRGLQAASLETSLDDGFGPDGRLWLYHETLPVIRQLRQWALSGIPRWEGLVFSASGPLIGVALRRYLGVDEAAATAALKRIDRVFDDIAERLSDGRRFLLGDRFTAADLTFAALSAPMLLPTRYGSPLPPPQAMPDALAREVRRLRSHPAGQFADRLYREDELDQIGPRDRRRL